MKKILFLIVSILLLFTLLSCNSELPSETPTLTDEPTESETQAHVHDYVKKKTSAAYLKSKATASSPAIYFYSCECGEKGSKTFEFGSKLESKTWTDINKTVYAMAGASLHTTTNDTKDFCENLWVGASYTAIATDGTWYKVEYPHLPGGVAYVMCKYVTDNVNEVTFDAVDPSCPAFVKDEAKGVYLSKYMDEKTDIFVSREAFGSVYMEIVAINKTKTWVKVSFCGTDSNGVYYDGSKTFYTSVKNLDIAFLQ